MAKRKRFVVPDIVRLTLSDGDWLEVKKTLTVGEERAAIATVIGRTNQDGSRTPNMDVLGMGEVAAYIVDWGGPGFTDAKDKPVAYSFDALKSIDPATYKEIDEAIDAHKAKAAAEADEAKKGHGEIELLAISSSAN